MKDLREYRIPFIGLKNGLHHFNYEVDDSFFSHFPASQISEAKIFVDLRFDKKDRLFILNFDISGSVKSVCDLCGQDFILPIHGTHTQYIKMGEEPVEITIGNEDVVWISEGESILDVSELLYEFIHLSLPMQKIHPDKPDGNPGCDPEILKLLQNSKAEADHTDPRWAALKHIQKD
ncbi:MAG: DUF177 domain-containing protein [Bacteroidetes bacterium]|nr:DUF177 domain-containing protein [Bacteroidota bacterium]MBK8680820.1 DUF177 domain-containing protein [Bacteroidota bacterium]